MKQIFYFSLILFVGVIASCTKKKGDAESAIIEEISCNLENRTADSLYFISDKKLNAGKFTHGKNMTTEKAKSGLGSIKLTGDAEFGLTYVIDKVETGDIFQVEVWRNGPAASGHLCVSGEKPEEFYQQNNKALEKNDKGWERISSELVVPVALNGKPLKVYVWNSDKKNIEYFDDIRIMYKGKKK